jgi:transposase-like protein
LSENDARQERGRAIAESGQIKRIDDASYKVNSQSGNGVYDVLFVEKGWKCSCPDFVSRSTKCKHIWAVEFSLSIREQVHSVRTEPTGEDAQNCAFCESSQTVRDGIRHNEDGDIQRFLCRTCGRKFTVNLGFERMKHNPKGITAAMQLYFSGESLRNTAKSLKLLGMRVSHQTVYKWIGKYVRLMKDYLDKLTPQVSDTWRADELYLNVNGEMNFLLALMDDETRFWIAEEVADSKDRYDARRLFENASEKTGKKPKTLITDGLHSYHKAYLKTYWTHKGPRTEHVRHIRFKGDMNNNRMERLNGEIRDREKVMRGLKRADSPIVPGYQIYHNYLRPHQGLKGRTPAEAAGISIQGPNKWVTLIGNASRNAHRRSIGN